MIRFAIMQCSRFVAEGNYTDALANGSFMDALTCPPINQMGPQVLPLMVFGTLGLALYVYTESLIVPLVLAVIIGAVFMSSLSGAPVGIAVLVLVMVLTLAVWLVYARMGRN